MKHAGLTVSTLVVMGVALGYANYGMAQSNAAAMPQPGAPQAQGQSPDEGGDEAIKPLFKVTSVELMRSAHPPELDIVRVRGLSSTDSWSEPQLVAVSRGPSADGMLDLLLVGRAPDEASNATKFGTLEAVFVIEPGHPYKGIRVRSATNTVKLERLPGYAEASGRDLDCSSCLGKYYVAKGGSAPSGKDVVREEDLPATTRVLKESDGIRKLDTDPNRLTLILGPGDQIVQAFWD
jgi:hypothetical protein